jgi:hypothetical protein
MEFASTPCCEHPVPAETALFFSARVQARRRCGLGVVVDLRVLVDAASRPSWTFVF